MKRVLAVIFLAMGIIFFLFGGEKNVSAAGTFEKTRVKLICGNNNTATIIRSQILANGGDYTVFVIGDEFFDCTMIIDAINIGEQRGNVTGAAVPKIAVVFGNRSQKFPVALWGIDSNSIAIPIDNTNVNIGNGSVAGFRIPTLGFILSNGFNGFDSSKVLEAVKNWDPKLYEEGKSFSLCWNPPISSELLKYKKWGIFDIDGKICTELQLMNYLPDGSGATFFIKMVFILLRTRVGTKTLPITN